MKNKTRFLSILLAIILMITQMPIVSAFSIENADSLNTQVMSNDSVSDNHQDNIEDTDLYFDASKDTLYEDLVENEKYLQSGEHHVRASSSDRVLAEDTLPSSVNLTPSKHIPPIENQGSIGCCASMGTVYMQFTNAISRYIEEHNIDDSWNPKEKKENRFAPKWTYNFVRATVTNIYKVLGENGATTMDKCDFSNPRNTTSRQSISWELDGMYDALKYRLTTPTSQDTYGLYSYQYEVLATEKGRELFNTVKSALVQGNVVTVNCYFYDFKYTKATGAGDIGTVGEYVVPVVYGSKSGYHQMSIVGYDDNLEAEYNGVTLKGAFLVANSHGTSYRNKGYVWVMYDALGKTSAFDELNDEEAYESPMNITIDDEGLAVYSPSYYAESSNWSFDDVGTTVVNGKTYSTYNIGRYNAFDGSVGPYISYADKKSDEIVLTNYATDLSAWSLIPYEDIVEWSNFDDDNFDSKYLGTYWLYATNRSDGSPVFLNSGKELALEGNDLQLSKLDAGVAETKSFILPNANESNSGSFFTKIVVDETKTELTNRHEAFDYYYVTYWDSDVVINAPNLILGVTMEAYDKYDCSIKLYNYNDTSAKKYYTPIFYASSSTKPYIGYSFSGLKTSELTAPETATLYFNLDQLKVDEGKKLTDYKWGAQINCYPLKSDQEVSGNDIAITDVRLISGSNDQPLASEIISNPKIVAYGESTEIEFEFSSYPTVNAIPEITATAGKESVEVKWNKVPKASGYYLYRKEITESTYTLIKDCKSSLINKYIDKDCNSNKLYQYAVKAYTEVNGQYIEGIQSEASNTATKIALGESTIKKAYEVEDGIQLTWDLLKGASGYRILYKTLDNDVWTVAKTVGIVNSMIDTEALKGAYRYYSVQPYRVVLGTTLYGDYNEEGCLAYRNIHSTETFSVGDKVSIKENAISPTAHNIYGKALEFEYTVSKVEGHFLTISLEISKNLLKSLGFKSFSDFLNMYGADIEDYSSLNTKLNTNVNLGETYTFEFVISSACCEKSIIDDSDTDTTTDTTTDTMTDSDTATDTQTDTETDSDTATDTTTDIETDSDTATDTQTDTETESDTTTDTTTDTETDSDTATDTQTDTETDSDTTTDTTTDTETDSDTTTDTTTDTDYGFKTGDEVHLTSNAQNIDGWLISKSVLELDYGILLVKDGIATLVLNVNREYLESINMNLGQLFVAVGYLDYESEDCPLDYNYLLDLINAGQEVSVTFKVHCKQLVPQEEKIELLYGDANCDGYVNMEDVTTIQKIIAKLTDYVNYGDNSEGNCDCDHNGEVTMTDVTLLQRFLAKLVEKL